jgi:ribosome biogenesis GTPase / thiamine phosphate phosphatase
MNLEALGWDDARHAAFAPFTAQSLLPGRVVGEHRTHWQVATVAAELTATVAGRLRHEAAQRSDLPGVGDFVALRLADATGNATIEAVLPRTSALIRKAAGESRPQLIAANVDVVLIVTALDGDLNLPRLQRYLTLVEAGGATAVIVANKTDLAADANELIEGIRAAAPGRPVHGLSARGLAATAVLEPYFAGHRTVALIGSSGVGKSTLTNQLLGDDVQAVGSVRGHDNRGRHTTTHRQLFLRAAGGSIMDTPGMRGLEVWDPESEVPAADFSDIEALAAQCKFRDCRHVSEPACAVRAAVASGQIDAAHLALYVAQGVSAKRGTRS